MRGINMHKSGLMTQARRLRSPTSWYAINRAEEGSVCRAERSGADIASGAGDIASGVGVLPGADESPTKNRLQYSNIQKLSTGNNIPTDTWSMSSAKRQSNVEVSRVNG